MKLIIAGSRTLKVGVDGIDYWILRLAESKGVYPTEIVCGCAPGVDSYGRAWAHSKGIPVAEFPADWTRHGRRAGPIRNQEMANYADVLLLMWDGHSRGSANMRREMNLLGKRVFEVLFPPTL